MEAAVLRLCEGLFHDFEIESFDLDVHLDRRDTVFRTGHLEIHVAEMVFGAEDVGQNRVLLPFLDQAHRNTGDGGLHRNASIEQRQRTAADGCHRRRAIRLEHFRHDANRVREIGEVRQHALQSTLGQVAVADFATTGAAHRTHFASGERREVVMQHEGAGGFARLVDGIESLRVLRRPQRRGHECLRLATGKERRAVRAGQQRRVDADTAHFIRLAAVDAKTRVEDLGAQLVVFDIAEGGVDVFRVVWEFECQLLSGRVLGLLDRLNAGVLVRLIQRRLDRLRRGLLRRFDNGDARLGLLPLHLRLLHLRQQLVLHVDELANAVVRDLQRLEHISFGDFQRATFDHDDGVLRTRDDEIHVRERELLERRVEHPMPLHAADAHAADRTHERNPRRVQCERRGKQCQDVRVILLIGRDDVDEHLHFVLEAFREERADRAIDDAARKDLMIMRAPFALDESAGDLTRGVGLLLVFDRQREEWERRLVVADRNGRKNHRLAELYEGGASRLLGHAAGLDDQRATREGPLDAMHHLLFLSGENANRAGGITAPARRDGVVLVSTGDQGFGRACDTPERPYALSNPEDDGACRPSSGDRDARGDPWREYGSDPSGS